MNLWTIDDGRLTLHFHHGQAEGWKSEKRITALVSGTQSGKTSWAPWWLWREIRNCGQGDYLAVTATFDLFKLKMLPEIRTVFEDVLQIGRYWAGDRVLEICEDAKPGGNFWANNSTDPMWGRVILRSADSPGGLESGTAQAAWLDEAGQDRFTIAAYRAIRRRLSLARGRILITTTLYNLAWVKREIIDAVKDAKVKLTTLPNDAEVEVRENGTIKLVQFDSIVNPLFPIEEYEEARASMPDDEFDMFYRGRAAKLRTLIYDVFDTTRTVASFTPPREWPVVVGVDPLGAHVAAVCLAFDPEKQQLHLFKEYKEPFGLPTGDHGENIRKLTTTHRVAAYVGGGPSERQMRTDFSVALGALVQPPPITDVWSQIRRVYTLFKEYALVVHESCEMIIDELGSYQRQRNRAGEMTDQIKDKESFDLLDATRYAVAWLTEPGEQTAFVYLPKRIGY